MESWIQNITGHLWSEEDLIPKNNLDLVSTKVNIFLWYVVNFLYCRPKKSREGVGPDGDNIENVTLYF